MASSPMEIEDQWVPLSVFGITIPPSKVAAELFGMDKSSKRYQRESWEVLERVIDDLIRDVDPGNLKETVAQLFAENIVRGKGLFCRSIINHQTAHPEKSYIYAALAFLVNYYFPAVGGLLVRRVYVQLILSYHDYNFEPLQRSLKLLAHLINLEVLEPLIGYGIVCCCLERKTSDYVKAAAEFFKELLLPKDLFGHRHHDFQTHGLGLRTCKCVNACLPDEMEIFCNGKNFPDDEQTGLHKHFSNIASNGELDQDAVKSVEEFLRIWDFIFDDYFIRFPEMDWLSRKHIHMHFQLGGCVLNLSIFQDDFKFDSLFLERELAFEWSRRLVLLEGHWQGFDNRRLRGERKRFEYRYDNYTEICAILLKVLNLMQFCLALLEEGIGWDDTKLCIKVFQLLCKENQLYQAYLEKCFSLVWLMLPGWFCPDMCRNASRIFGTLLKEGTISWDVLAYLQLMPQERTEAHEIFASRLFMSLVCSLPETEISEKIIGSDRVKKSLFPEDDHQLCRSAINYFNAIEMSLVAKDIKRLRFPVVG
ncbi:hypothetical protein BUALT_Bualt07G0161400 [Buddleja alternifolia]|uniref:Uncharacterized protein n=1 Tax=Buddleja alternifolia TaxID=168488 RepID=A0AAV6XCF5_9LAMI|nr:hypothetical protein BUALT_Bualt07G0161400 [Buddleja alternifolia]